MGFKENTESDLIDGITVGKEENTLFDNEGFQRAKEQLQNALPLVQDFIAAYRRLGNGDPSGQQLTKYVRNVDEAAALVAYEKQNAVGRKGRHLDNSLRRLTTYWRRLYWDPATEPLDWEDLDFYDGVAMINIPRLIRKYITSVGNETSGFVLEQINQIQDQYDKITSLMSSLSQANSFQQAYNVNVDLSAAAGDLAAMVKQYKKYFFGRTKPQHESEFYMNLLSLTAATLFDGKPIKKNRSNEAK